MHINNKWEKIREKGMIIYILKYFIIFGVGIPLIKISILFTRAVVLHSTMSSKDMLSGLKFDLIFFSSLSILASTFQWILNEKKFKKMNDLKGKKKIPPT